MILNLHKPEKLLKKIGLIALFNLFVISLTAQFVNYGTEPFSVKWKQIETLNYIVIYPEDAESKAIEYAAKLELAYSYINHSIGFRPKKFAYVLHSYSATSNGLTAVAPNRVEVWTKPHQDIYGQNWDEQLILHEGRHIAQFQSMYRGASKLPIWLTGQMGYSFPIGLYVPLWFMEGDAIVAETALTKFGRGRLPGFEKGMRAYFLQKNNPGYDKMILGSYRDYIPNYYETGYQVVAANRVFRDKDLFKNKLRDIARYPWYLWPFSRKSNGLKDTRKFKYYSFAADTLMSLWRVQDKKVDALLTEYLYTSDDYTGLHYLRTQGGRLYAMQRDYKKVPSIVEIFEDGTLKPILKLGYSSGKYFDVKGDMMAVTLDIPNARWEQLSTASIFLVHPKDGTRRRLTHTNSYYAPVFHPIEDRLAAVEMDDRNRCHIAILNAETGEVIQRLNNPTNDYIITPQWTYDGQHLVYIKVTENGKALIINDFAVEKVLLEPGNVDIRHPFLKGDTVYISGDWSGIENIFAIPLSGGEPKMITNSRFGAVSPVWLNQTLSYLDYTWKGNYVAMITPKKQENRPLSLVENHAVSLYKTLALQEPGVVDFALKDSVSYSGKRYNKFLKQFNFHSWLPVASYKLSQSAIVPGVSLVSQSLLNDAVLAVGFNYLEGFWDEKFYFNYIYRGFFPVIHFNAYYGDQKVNRLHISTPDANFTDHIFRLESKIELPLTWRKFDNTIGLIPNGYGNYGRLTRLYENPEVNTNYATPYNWGFGVLHYNLKQKGYRDLFSPLGYLFSLNHQQFRVDWSDGRPDTETSSLGLEANLYFPGFLKYQNLILKASFLQVKGGTYFTSAFSQPVSMPAGWQSLVNEPYGDRNFRFGAEYFFPVGNIDADIFWLAYFKRLNMGLWADYGRFEYDQPESTEINPYSIFGATVYADVHLFRYPVELKVGFKAGYSPSHERRFLNLVLNINSPF